MERDFFESGSNGDFTDFTETSPIGSFGKVNSTNTFETIYEEACKNYESQWRTSFNPDFLNVMTLKNKQKVGGFKKDMLGVLEDDVRVYTERAADKEFAPGHAGTLYDETSLMFDKKIDMMLESAQSVGPLMPIKMIDLPVMVKAHIAESFKNVVNQEITPSMIVKKRIEHNIAYDKKDPSKQWEYPQCFYDDSFREMMKAGEGVTLDDKACELPLNNFNIVEELTNAPVSHRERIVIDLEIDRVDVADPTANVAADPGATPPVEASNGVATITLRTPMKVNLADGMWVGGNINETYKNSKGELKTLRDVITGFTDWVTNTTHLSHTNTTDGVLAVHFKGKLSNERNEHAIRTRWEQKDYEWTIGEGCKIDASFSLESLQEHKALLNMDLYQKAYNDIMVLLSATEDSKGYDWLDEEFDKYDGSEFDPLQWNPVVLKTKFNCDSTIATVALQSEYINSQLKFLLDRFLIDIADTVKLDNLNFVIYGNPRFISLLQPNIEWIFKTGQSVGGVKLDHGYGVITSNETNVYVVSSKKISASKRRGIRIIPFTTDKNTITFKRYKFSTDIITSDKSAYKDTESAGGSMTYVWGTSRYKDVSLQGIQGEILFENDDFITIK